MRDLNLVDKYGVNYPVTMKELHDRVVNFDACLDSDGKFKIRGTKYIFYDEIEFDLIHIRMIGYGGYETGGRGCFYIPVGLKSM